jgi:hypothetical protein
MNGMKLGFIRGCSVQIIEWQQQQWWRHGVVRHAIAMDLSVVVITMRNAPPLHEECLPTGLT